MRTGGGGSRDDRLRIAALTNSRATVRLVGLLRDKLRGRRCALEPWRALLSLQASCCHLVQHTRLTVVDRGRVVAPTRGSVCSAVQAMSSPMGGVGPPPGRESSARQGHLRVPLSAAARQRPCIVVMVGSRSSRRRWMRTRVMEHTAVVALRRSSDYLRASRALINAWSGRRR